MAYTESIQAIQSTPSNPTGTSSATAVMMGLAGAITPRFSGRVLIMLSGVIFNAGIGQGATPQLSWGTGAAPTNGAALTGNQVGGAVPYVAATITGKAPFALQAVVTGLTLNTAVWLDLALSAQTAGTATVSNLSLTAAEL